MAVGRTSVEKAPRRRSVTRERLLRTADACFLARGFHGSSVEWLAAQAGYTTGAIYSNFRDKTGLFLAVLERRTQDNLDSWQAAASSPDPERTVATSLEQMLKDEKGQQWTSAYLEFYAHAVRDPELKATVSALTKRTNKALTEVLRPLARRTSMPAGDFARIMSAVGNGLALATVTDETVDAARLMRTVLRALRQAAPANQDE